MAGMTSMNASPTGGVGSGNSATGDHPMRQQQQQQQSGALHTQQHTRSSSSSSDPDALPWRVQSPARSSGVRRRREESIEIEELDSDTMRQNAYNYFQRYASRSSAPAYNISGPGGNGNSSNGVFSLTTAADRTSPVLRTGSSRKRQRTLADRLDELSIGSMDYFGHRRGGGGRTNGNRSSASSADAMMDGDSSSDERRDSEAEDEDSGGGARSELMVYGGVPSMKGFFFGSSRRKPMDRVFRHYAAVANQAASSAEMNGNELVLFRRAPPSPPPTPAFLANLPYLSLSPQELEALTRQERSKRAPIVELNDKDDGDDQDAGNGRRTGAASSIISGGYRSRSGSGSCSASSTSSPPFRALGVPRVDSMEDFDDVDMDGEGEPKQPHLLGDVSHSEWFLSDDEL